MKTINSAQKTENKTENKNIKLSAMKTLAVFTSVVLFSFMSNANGNNNQEFLAGSINIANYATAAEIAHYAEAVAEESMEIESWMTNENLFNAESNNLMEATLEAETEESMEVEEWMINENFFTAPVPVAETEGSLDIEQWMLNNENFAPTTFMTETDKAMDVESWMLTSSIWGM